MSDTLSRGVRRVVALLALTVVSLTMLTMSGCSSDDEPSSDAETRTVQTDHGAVDVPQEPARVVAADYFAGFTLIDLGAPLVGVSGSDYADQEATYAEGAKDAEVVGTFTDVDYEAIAAVEPDLIIRSIDTDDETYKQLSAIAPTVVISFEGLSLTEVTERIGDAVGRQDEATDLIDALDGRASEISGEYADLLSDTTFALVTPTEEGQWWLYGPSWTDLTVLTQAGAILAPPADQQTEQVVEYSFEQLGVLDSADVILLDAYIDNSEFTSSALWPGLPAVQANRTFPITTGTSSIGNALALLDTFEEILTQLAAS